MTKDEQKALMEQAEIAAGSLPKLAAMIGVRNATVYRWLHGTRRMNGMAVRVVRGVVEEKKGGRR